MSHPFGKFISYFLFFFLSTNFCQGQNDLPSPASNIQSIKNGALIISMDTNFQKLPGIFNLKAYGLINELLQNEIPVKWVIKSGKTRSSAGSIDFTTNVKRVSPDTLNMGAIAFRSGAFIIDSTYADTAMSIIKTFGNNVAVFYLNNTLNMDVRYTLTHKPRILLLNSSGYDTIAVKYLIEAGISSNSYKLQMPAGTTFNSNGKWSLISETHLHSTDTGVFNPLLRYSVQQGANLILACATLGAMENTTLTMTTAGVDSFSTGLAAVLYNNPDLPIAQFLGTIMSPNGEYKLWRPKTGSTMRPNTYEIMRGGAGGFFYTMAGMKMRPNNLAGGNMFYIAGHEHYQWTASSGSINDINRINGRRIFLNSIFIPASDSIDGIDFKTDVAVKMIAQTGWAVKYEDFTIKIAATNIGPGTARRLNLNAILPTGLLYKTHSASHGTFNPITGIWAMDSLQKKQSDTLTLTVKINSLGNIVYPSVIVNPSYELTKINNFDTLYLFGISRPVAVNDTLQFSAASFVDYPVKINDYDEDGGPFANATILAGPFRGTATVLNGDSIRYTLTSFGFTGTDSLQYLTCDNYPLCDTAWFFITISSPLPVSLTNFTGKRVLDEVKLEWFTLSEKNNDYFEIERSINGLTFEKRGQLKGYGTSNFINRYTFSDTEHPASMLYYRLQQYDFDGTNATSKIIALSKYGKNEFSASIYPNPSDGYMQVIRAIGVSGELSLIITDLGGRVISEQYWDADTNGSILEFSDQSQKLSAGCYIATFRNAEKMQTLKLIVR